MDIIGEDCRCLIYKYIHNLKYIDALDQISSLVITRYGDNCTNFSITITLKNKKTML